MAGIKEDVEIKEQPKTPQQELLEKVLERLEKPVTAPPIEETLEKVNAALKLAQKAKPLRRHWYCTDCGRIDCQNDKPGFTGEDHIRVTCIDGEFTQENGEPLPASHMQLMTEYAVPKAKGPYADHQISANRKTLANMAQLKAGGKQ